MFNRNSVLLLVGVASTLFPLTAVAQSESPFATAAQAESRFAASLESVKSIKPARPRHSLMITNKLIEVSPGDPSTSIGQEQTIRVVGPKQPKVADPRKLVDARAGLNPRSLADLLKPLSIDGADEEFLMEQSLACNREATVTVLAREITYGPTGPDVPLRIDYQMGAATPSFLFGGEDITVGQVSTMTLGFGGEELVLWGKMAYPSFAEPNLYDEVPNNHPNNAAILQNGDDLQDVLDAKQAHGPYGTQIDLTEILNDEDNPNTETDYLDDDGKIRLPNNEFIVLYELGTRDQQSPAFDFNDLVLKVKTDCGVGSEVMLRDSIGEDNTSTNGNFSFSDWRMTSWYIIHIPVTATTSNLKLIQWRAIVAPTQLSNFNWPAITYKVMVWSSMAAAQASPQTGNISNFDLPALSYTPATFGMTGDPEGIVPAWPTRDFILNISNLNIQVPAGQTRVIGVQALPGAGSNGLFGLVESTQTGATDRQCGSTITGGCQDTANTIASLHDGRMAVSVLAEVN